MFVRLRDVKMCVFTGCPLFRLSVYLSEVNLRLTRNSNHFVFRTSVVKIVLRLLKLHFNCLSCCPIFFFFICLFGCHTPCQLLTLVLRTDLDILLLLYFYTLFAWSPARPDAIGRRAREQCSGVIMYRSVVYWSISCPYGC